MTVTILAPGCGLRERSDGPGNDAEEDCDGDAEASTGTAE